MARLLTFGCEITAAELLDQGTTNSSAITRDTITVRSGAAAYKLSGTSTSTYLNQLSVPGAASTDTWYARCYIYFASAPTAASSFFQIGSSGSLLTTGICAALNTDQTVSLMVGGVAQSPASAVLATSTWHRIELRGVLNTTTGVAELVVNGTSVVSLSSFNTGSPSFGQVAFGTSLSGTARGVDLFVDDVALNNQSGTNQTTFPGDGKVILLVPLSDNLVGSGWTTSSNTTTNLWDCVDNQPPVGVTDTTANAGKQIRNATSNTNAYKAAVTDYATAGLTASDTINVVHPIVNTGAPSGTSAKNCNIAMDSNPAGSASSNFTFYAGAIAGTYPAGWKWTQAAPVYAPSVTLGTNPVVTVQQQTASTRIGLVDFLAMYVDYTPAAAASSQVYVPHRQGPNFRR